ncbi:unnamed protein product [Protopolystoma xenopodis]|uniref:Uncharacterized protein n=1 Tax=Protopolystoma xenopodis TaxID=117903 RepID=A0A448WMB2_9PLAT|nr:unnamed protein product [Protopolystoma xenopodis]
MLPSLSSGWSDSSLRSGSASWACMYVSYLSDWPILLSSSPSVLLLQAIFSSLTSTFKVTSSTERLGFDSHACGYWLLPPHIISLIKPVYPEQTVDIYLWSPITSQVDVYSILMLFRISVTVVNIRMPSHMQRQAPEVIVGSST